MAESSLPPVSAAEPPRDPAIQAALDADHLRLLEIGFLISGILTALRFVWFLFVAIFFVAIGITASVAAAHHQTNPNNAPPVPVFIAFGVFFGALILAFLIFACLEIYAGVCLKKRRHPVFIQIVAGITCIWIPWGTALGIFTFMVLNRPSVKPMFERS